MHVHSLPVQAGKQCLFGATASLDPNSGGYYNIKCWYLAVFLVTSWITREKAN